MQRSIRGVTDDSCIFFHTASQFALNSLFYIVSCGHFYCNKDYSCIRRDMNNIQVLYVSEGSGMLKYDEKVYPLNTGDCFIIDCNIPHSYYPYDHWETWWCHFDGLSSRALQYQFIVNNGPVIKLYGSSQIPMLLDSIIRYEDANIISNEIEISSAIHRILSEALMQSMLTNSSKENAVSLVKKFMHDNFRNKITLQELCAISYTSMYHLSRLFKRSTGFSPYEYITTLRMNEAKTLLISTNMTIKEIAFAIGYSSESNFIRIFASYIRLTPNQFRKNYL